MRCLRLRETEDVVLGGNVRRARDLTGFLAPLGTWTAGAAAPLCLLPRQAAWHFVSHGTNTSSPGVSLFSRIQHLIFFVAVV